MGRIFRYDSAVKYAVVSFCFTASALFVMLAFVKFVRFPIAKTVTFRFCNGFFFRSTAYRTGVSLYAFF